MNYYEMLLAQKLAKGELPPNAYLLKTASGSLVSFTDGADLPMPSFICKIEAVQSGSGDPSPENVRPISGHTGVDAWVRGKNLLKTTDELSWIPSLTKNADGTIRVVGSRTSNGAYIIGTVDLKANTKYTFRKSGSSDLYYQVWVGETLVTTVGINNITYTPTSDVTATIRIFARANITYDTVLYPQIEIGSTATEYEPYNSNSQTIQVSWQTEAGEVYGGYVDLVSGVLTVTDGYIASYDGEILPSTWISDSDVYAEGTTPTTGAEVVYKLAEAQTYQLTPTQIKSLLGINNAWCSTGDVTLEYFGKGAE